MRSSLVRIAVLAAAVCAWPAQAAHASGTLSLSGGRLIWTGTSGADTLTASGTAVPRPAPQPPLETLTFRSASAIAVAASAAAACGDPATTVTCARGAVTVVEANGSAGADTLTYDDTGIFRLSLPADFDGGTGDDRLNGSATGDVALRGGSDVDVIDGEGGNDVIDGDDGLASTPDSRDVLDGGLGEDNIEGEGGNDSIVGGDGSDARLAGDAGNDTIQGGDGEDVIDGGEGEDTVIAGPENDVVNGGAGIADRIRYDEPNRGGPVVVDLATGTAGKDGGPGETTEDALGFERVTGTAADDSLTGDAQVNQLNAGGGDDVLLGAGANDVLRGGDGLDTVSYAERGPGAPVAVTLDGAAGDGAAGESDDVGSDIENAVGGAGGDRLTGNDGPNALEGGPGADALNGLGGADAFRAGAGDDTVQALDGSAETVDCGDGAGDQADADRADQLIGCETARVPPGPVDGDGNGPGPPRRDADGDGSPDNEDCDDANPARSPDAAEILGNAVDENCRGGPAPFPVVAATSELTSQRVRERRRVNLLALSVFDLRGGETVTVACRGRCSRNLSLRRAVRRRTSRLRLDRAVLGRWVRTGSTLLVRVARPGFSAKTKEYRMRQSGPTPVVTRRLCDLPGGGKDGDCDGFRDLPLPRATARLGADAGKRRTRLRTLRVAGLRGGDTVALSCNGRGCPPSLGGPAIVPGGTRALRLDRRVRGAALRPRARLDVAIARAGFATRVFRWTMRAGREPRRQALCQAPSDRRPGRCPGS
jgi:Ca2+-binding RTX toxin-like protein